MTLTADPDYETKDSYSFTVTATDAANNTSPATTVTFSISDVDDTAPVITSVALGIDLMESSGPGQSIYTITATDAVGVTSYAIGGTDAALLTVNASTGVVSLNADPVYATKSSYSFTVTASDAANNTTAATSVTFSINEFICGNSVHYDGHFYATVAIGSQCWFKENLQTTVFADGSSIPADLDDAAWSTTTAGAVTVYGDGTSNVNNNNSNNDEVANLANYGRLYNWYAVDDASGLCPSGWHVPTDSEYMTLEMELGMSSTDADISAQWRGTNEGEKLKSSSGDAPPWSGTNTSGFSGLPGGNRVQPGDFMWGGNNGYFWTASPRGTNAWYRKFEGGRDNIYRNYTVKGAGLTVRCVWD